MINSEHSELQPYRLQMLANQSEEVRNIDRPELMSFFFFDTVVYLAKIEKCKDKYKVNFNLD